MATTTTDATGSRTTYLVIVALSLCHLVNDVMQSLIAAIFPILKVNFDLDFWQIGLITLGFQATAALLQPVIGMATDRYPFPQALAAGMGATVVGLGLLAAAPAYGWLLAGACLIGIGSAVFHPEAARVARLAAGGRFGTAQSLFQVGGTSGQALGPLLAALIIVPLGQPAIAWFAVFALIAMVVLQRVGVWHARFRAAAARAPRPSRALPLARRRTVLALIILMLLVFSKSIYTAGLTSYYTFFLIERFELTLQQSQLMLFLFMGAFAFGVVLGGPLADRFGATPVIWASSIGVLPFTLLLPHVDLASTAVLSVLIGALMAIASPVIIVFSQELVPGRIGLVSGIFFGFAFGMGGIAAVALGVLADVRGIAYVFELTAILPAIGLAAVLLPRRGELLAGAADVRGI